MFERVLRFSKNSMGILFFLLMLFLTLLIFLMGKGAFWSIPLLPRMDLGQPWFLHVVTIAGGLLLLIPLLLAALGFLRWLFPTIPWKKPIGVLGTIWILALMTLVWTGAQTYQHFQKMKETVTQWTSQLPWKEKAVLDVRQMAASGRLQIGPLSFGMKDPELLHVGSKVKLVASSQADFEVTIHQRNFGANRESSISLPIEQIGDTLLVSDYITYHNSKPYAGQEYQVVIGIPPGKILMLSEEKDAMSIFQSEDILKVESDSGTFFKVH